MELPARALAGFVAYLDFGLDLRDDNVYWNAADPGWAYGLYHAIVAPLAAGRSIILLSGGFSAALTWSVLDRLAVTNLAAAPTVYRALPNNVHGTGGDLRLRCLSSAGEALCPQT